MTEMGSLEFASLSPASSIRQRVRYSMGDAPTVSLNFRAKVDRDMPARSASSCNVQPMRRIVVHGVDRCAHLFIRQGEEPPDATFQPFRQMQPQGLNQHHVGEVLCDQKAARLRLAQLLHHPLHRPAQRRLVRFFPDMHDGRQHPQQDAGMIAGKGEVAADKKEIPAAIVRDDAAIPRGRKNRAGVDRRQASGRSQGGKAARSAAGSSPPSSGAPRRERPPPTASTGRKPRRSI